MGTLTIRDLRKKDQYKIDDAYLNGYARLCGVFATAVYNSLSRHANFHTQECFPSIDSIAEQHNINRKTVIRAIATLAEYGIVRKVKSKDPVTKKQLTNVYILTDKSTWQQKPSPSGTPGAESTTGTRVLEESNKSRVPLTAKAESPTGTVRIQIEKGTKKSTTLQPKAAGGDIQQLMAIFYDTGVNPGLSFGNTTQRKATEWLLQRFGKEKAERTIRFACEVQGRTYAPTITTPYQLKEKLGQLIVYAKKHQTQSIVKIT